MCLFCVINTTAISSCPSVTWWKVRVSGSSIHLNLFLSSSYAMSVPLSYKSNVPGFTLKSADITLHIMLLRLDSASLIPRDLTKHQISMFIMSVQVNSFRKYFEKLACCFQSWFKLIRYSIIRHFNVSLFVLRIIACSSIHSMVLCFIRYPLN